MSSDHVPEPTTRWVRPAYPAFSPPPYPPPSPRRRWPALAAAAAAGAVVAAPIASVIATQAAGHRATTAPARVTVTDAPAPPPLPPAPLPAAQADRQTCDAWHAAGDKIHAASRSISVLPGKMTILDPQVRTNPQWSAAVVQAADFYGQAGDILLAGIAPGTSVMLSKTATATGEALHALSTSEAAFDATNGNAYDAVHNSADSMDVLCERLAPR